MTVTREMLTELEGLYIDDFSNLVGKTIVASGTTWDSEKGYLIFDTNEFTIVESEDFYGSSEFKAKNYDNIHYDLTDVDNYLLKIISEYTTFNIEDILKQAEDKRKVEEARKLELEKQRKYNEYLKLKAEFETE